MENQNQDLKKLMEDVQRLKDEQSFFGTTKSFTKGLIIGLGLTSVIALAVTVTKPHTFSAGNPISATEVNANFDALYNHINNNDLGYAVRYTSNQVITCTPYPPTLNKSNPDIQDFNDGGFSAGTYTVTTTATYVLYYQFYSTSSMGSAFEIRVNGTPVMWPYPSSTTGSSAPLRLSSGDTVELWLGCDDKKTVDITLDAAKTFMLLKKI